MTSNPERLAWTILLSAFVAFLLLCGGVAYLVQWYIFESRIPLSTELVAARGTVRVVLPNTLEEIAVTDRRPDLEPGTVIRTDTTSQAVLTFSDQREDRPVASVVLLADGEITLEEGSTPRFSLNNSSRTITIRSDVGRIEVLIVQNRERDTRLVLVSPHSETAITSRGQYFVDVAEQQTRVAVRQGQAAVTHRTAGLQAVLVGGQRTVVELADDEIPLLPAETPLVVNGSFINEYGDGWIAYNTDQPEGIVDNQIFDGRPTVVIDRSQANWPDLRLDHGETGLIQTLNVNVQGYSSLELHATFFVEEQSLSMCGIAGSECPLMIRMVYVDPLGIQREYIQGFYAYRDPAVDWPLACSTCRSDHERINVNSWYTFRSGNLLTNLPAELMPVFIRELRFYASGHAYKVFVSEMELLASN